MVPEADFRERSGQINPAKMCRFCGPKSFWMFFFAGTIRNKIFKWSVFHCYVREKWNSFLPLFRLVFKVLFSPWCLGAKIVWLVGAAHPPIWNWKGLKLDIFPILEGLLVRMSAVEASRFFERIYLVSEPSFQTPLELIDWFLKNPQKNNGTFIAKPVVFKTAKFSWSLSG